MRCIYGDLGMRMHGMNDMLRCWPVNKHLKTKTNYVFMADKKIFPRKQKCQRSKERLAEARRVGRAKDDESGGITHYSTKIRHGVRTVKGIGSPKRRKVWSPRIDRSQKKRENLSRITVNN